MRSFAEAGLDAAGLGVDTDSPTGAFRLYESMGYRATDTTVMYANRIAESWTRLVNHVGTFQVGDHQAPEGGGRRPAGQVVRQADQEHRGRGPDRRR